MPYRIVYGPEPNFFTSNTTQLPRRRILTASALLAFIILVRGIWPQGTTVLRQYLLPGEPTVTQTAANSLLEDLREGASLDEAVTAFCREIISHS